MKTMKPIAIALTVLLSSFVADQADAGFRSKFKKHFPKPSRFWAPAPPRPFVPRMPAVHVHRYSVRTEQVWVAPVYQTVVVGYQACGTPIYQQVVTQPGYYRTVRYNCCSCGHRYYL